MRLPSFAVCRTPRQRSCTPFPVRHSCRVAVERARAWLQQDGHRVLISRDSVYDDSPTYAFDREAQSLVQVVCRVLDGATFN